MPHFPILGFVAGTPLLTVDGPKRIEDIKPGNMIQVQPSDDQGDDKPHVHEDTAPSTSPPPRASVPPSRPLRIPIPPAKP